MRYQCGSKIFSLIGQMIINFLLSEKILLFTCFGGPLKRSELVHLIVGSWKKDVTVFFFHSQGLSKPQTRN